ncbi:cytochrome c family protein [Beijerinckiaceae bacterium]|nr:cytochrome c family protein [Beijerinckiaceae bacterium]
MNSFELNKIAGACLGTLLFTMCLWMISGAIFSHHKLAVPGYPLPSAPQTAPTASSAAPTAQPIAERLANADEKKGAADVKACATCHSFDKGGAAKIGPPLYAIVDRPKGSVAGFEYSETIKSSGGKWTYEDLDQFIANPKAYAPGTKMAFAGEQDPAKRADIIDYLHSLADDPAPLPTK